MSIAELVARELMETPYAACTLQGGYAVLYNGDRRTLPPARILHESRDGDGHVRHIVAEYADRSQLCFSWCKNNGAKYYVKND